MLPAPALLLVGLVLGFLILIPARRLQLAGFSARAIGSYAVVLWGLAFLLAVRPAGTRLLVPILLVAYLAPFVVAPDRFARIVRRRRVASRPAGGTSDTDHSDGPPPIKNVTPADSPRDPGPLAAADDRGGPDDQDPPSA